MSESQILQRRASRLASGAYREKIARLEAELAAARERIGRLILERGASRNAALLDEEPRDPG